MADPRTQNTDDTVLGALKYKSTDGAYYGGIAGLVSITGLALSTIRASLSRMMYRCVISQSTVGGNPRKLVFTVLPEPTEHYLGEVAVDEHTHNAPDMPTCVNCEPTSELDTMALVQAAAADVVAAHRGKLEDNGELMSLWKVDRMDTPHLSGLEARVVALERQIAAALDYTNLVSAKVTEHEANHA